MRPKFDQLYWQSPLEAFFGLIENVQNVRQEVQGHAEAGWLQYVFDRAILLAKETHCLLSEGYPDGAMARARCLAELTVCAFFINAAAVKEDKNIGQKYIDHTWVQKRKFFEDLLAYHNFAKKTPGYTEGMEKEHDLIKTQLGGIIKKIEEFKKKYGDDFSKAEFGWAYTAVRKRNEASKKTIVKCGSSKKQCCKEICCDNPCCKELRVTLIDLINAIEAKPLLGYIFALGNQAVHAGALPSIIVFNDPSLENRLSCFGSVRQGLYVPLKVVGLCLMVILSLTYDITKEEKIKATMQRHNDAYYKIWPAIEAAERKAIEEYKEILVQQGLRKRE